MRPWAQLARYVRGASESVQLKRTPAGAYDEHGRYIELEPETTTIQAAVQPAKQEELVRAEEGRRVRGGVKIYTETELFTASVEDQRQADVIVWDGIEWEVEEVNDWEGPGDYYKVLAVRKGQ